MEKKQEIMGRIQPTVALSDAKDCDLIVEVYSSNRFTVEASVSFYPICFIGHY